LHSRQSSSWLFQQLASYLVRRMLVRLHRSSHSSWLGQRLALCTRSLGCSAAHAIACLASDTPY
jgi:hypothetical protein